MKAAIVILSDPKSGSDEALGRVFNGLATAYDFKQRGDEVTILFQGAATRWIGELANQEHPVHNLFSLVQDKVGGISHACSDVFGGADEAARAGVDRIKGNPVPGTNGLPSLQKLVSEGYHLLTF
jgi:hypothetical protein